MFYSHVLFAKKGPLAKVWQAAFFENKINRLMLANTDIGALSGASSLLPSLPPVSRRPLTPFPSPRAPVPVQSKSRSP